ncbi:MAG: hypothetical protein ABGX16_19180 [Pirellulales bacterium]
MVGWSGCNDRGLVDIQGNITLDDQPLPGGVIVFEPVDGNGATAGGKIREGRYELMNEAAVPPGEKIVRISGVFKTGRQIEVGPPAPPGTMTDEVEHIAISAIYNQSSTLRVNVVAGKLNQHDFKLRSR